MTTIVITDPYTENNFIQDEDEEFCKDISVQRPKGFVGVLSQANLANLTK